MAHDGMFFITIFLSSVRSSNWVFMEFFFLRDGRAISLIPALTWAMAIYFFDLWLFFEAPHRCTLQSAPPTPTPQHYDFYGKIGGMGK